MPETKPKLHLVAFDVPEPPDYGGAIDIYYKLKALHEVGVEVTLHAFAYGRRGNPENLRPWCQDIHIYRRRVFKNPFYGEEPYITSSRDAAELMDNLLADEAPILFEGLHSCHWLDDPRLARRVKVIRTHNIEHEYYRNLEHAETNYFKKYFFRVEAERLQRFEPVLKKASLIAAISPDDTGYFSSLYGHTEYIPAFHPNEKVEIKEGLGDFVLYHGNLGVGENNQGALYLVKEVFSRLQIPCVIAGSNPSAALRHAVSVYPHIKLEDQLDTAGILELVATAQVNVLCTFQGTGIKLKLINALFRGRHCVTNRPMVNHTGLENLCHVHDDPAEMAAAIESLMELPFDEAEQTRRAFLLSEGFNNLRNAARLMDAVQQLNNNP
jgi:hypothetical protein